MWRGFTWSSNVDRHLIQYAHIVEDKLLILYAHAYMHTCVHKYTILVIMPYACTTLHVHRDMMYFNGVELSDALDDFNRLHVEQVNVIAERLTHQLHPHRHINIHA